MPVFNALPYLDEAVASIIGQTFADFGLAIYDDHSTDGSYERALEWAARDPRVTVKRGDFRAGPSASSNAAAYLAQTELVARMDADDVAAPERLELQVKALREHPSAVLVGSTFEMIDGTGRLLRRAAPGRISGTAPPFAHPSIMYRRSSFQEAGGYRPGTDYFEDLDLYLRMATLGQLLVINRPLVSLRFAGQHARLRDDPAIVLERINRFYADGETPVSKSRTLSPMSFYSVAVLAIIGLERPRLFATMVRKVRFTRPVQTIVIMAIIGVAEISPRVARGLASVVAGARGMVSHRKFSEEKAYPWTFAQVR